jgi:NAD(P)-dependent dehydrogenase (short-subunit alcohol dehydrogenase family)
LDFQINSAGVLVNGKLENTSEEDYDRQMDGNVRSVFLMTKFAIPHLINTKGTIVNVSSVCGQRVVSINSVG